MAEKILQTRIQLKYDTLANWTAADIILKKGEIAVVEVPTGASASGLTPPAIGIKVGNGIDKFSALPYIQALAGDVYAWAKAAEKPTYTSAEISDLSIAIAAGNTVYRISADGNKYTLQSKAQSAEDTDYVTVSTIDLTNALAAKQDALTFNTTYDANTNKAATMQDIANAISGLTGAMHFIGTTTTVVTNGGAEKPTINDAEVAPAAGDVVIYGAAEYVYDGTAWKLLGDEGSYAVKGSIKNADIAADAAIEQSKIAGLSDALAAKTTDTDLATIAKTGKASDLVQDKGEVLVFNCGSATVNV